MQKHHWQQPLITPLCMVSPKPPFWDLDSETCFREPECHCCELTLMDELWGLRVFCSNLEVPRTGLFLDWDVSSGICWSHFSSIGVTGPSAPMTKATTVVFTWRLGLTLPWVVGNSPVYRVPFSWSFHHWEWPHWSKHTYVLWFLSVITMSGLVDHYHLVCLNLDV